MASNNSLSLRFVLEKDNGANFIDSSQNLRRVLKQEKRLEVPNQALPNEQEMFQEQARHERFVGFSLCLNMSNTFNIAAELQQAQRKYAQEYVAFI